MRLGSKSRYAVMAMVDLARSGEGDQKAVSLTLISQRQNLPLPYLEQLFNRLKKSGLVKSVRGAAGGYALAFDARKIRIFDIIQSVEASPKSARCSHQGGSGCQHDGAKCLTHDLWEGLDHMIDQFFMGVTLQDILQQNVGNVDFFASKESFLTKDLLQNQVRHPREVLRTESGIQEIHGFPPSRE